MDVVTLPERIGRYRILGELGRGAMGRVYVAYDPNLERRVALKVMSPAAGEDPEDEAELRQRFLLEARAAGRLAHPGIVAVHDADTDAVSGLPYIAMELIEGESLEALLRREGRLAPLLAVDLVARVARALGYAHARGVVHRDVKPANILLAVDGAAKIADFGIAKLGGLGVTRAGRVLGSPFFMSPEQVQGLAVDGRSDLFSLGGVLYRALTGELPFPGDGLVTVAFKVVQVDPRPIDPTLELPEALAALLARSMAKEPALRFASADEMAEELESIAANIVALPGRLDVRRAVLAPAAALLLRGAHAPGTPFDRGETLVLDGDGTAPPPPPAPLRQAAMGRSSGRRLGVLLASGLTLLAAAGVAAWLARSTPERPPFESSLEPRALPAAVAPAGESTSPRADPDEAPAAVRPPARLADSDRPPPRPVESSNGGAAPSEVVSAAPALEAASASSILHFAYRNRLGSATMSIWLDGEAVWSRELETGPNPLLRAFGEELLETLAVPAGEHELEVRVRGRSMEVDASAKITGRFEPGGRRWLRITLNPYAEKVKLAWAGE